MKFCFSQVLAHQFIAPPARAGKIVASEKSSKLCVTELKGSFQTNGLGLDPCLCYQLLVVTSCSWSQGFITRILVYSPYGSFATHNKSSCGPD